nr:transposase [Xenococcaceae cyanobacterium MO_188.B32]
WRNRNKVIGSANWKKAQIKIARLHRRIANIRKDTLHKLTTYLASAIRYSETHINGGIEYISKVNHPDLSSHFNPLEMITYRPSK